MRTVGTYMVVSNGVTVVENEQAAKATIIYSRFVFAGQPATLIRTDFLEPALVADYTGADLREHAEKREPAAFSPVRWGYAMGAIEAMGGLHPLDGTDAAVDFAMMRGQGPMHFQWTEFERARRPEGPPRIGLSDEALAVWCPCTDLCDVVEDDDGTVTCLTHSCPYGPDCERGEEPCNDGCYLASGMGHCTSSNHTVCYVHDQQG